MLQQLRSTVGGFFSKILLTLLILSFAVWGVEDMFLKGAGSDDVATIGGERISARQFQAEMQRRQEGFRQTLGDSYSPELITQLGLHKYILKEMINSALYRLEAESLGLRADDESAFAMIRNDAAFRGKDSKFDQSRFRQYVRDEAGYVKAVKDALARKLVQDTTKAEDMAPSALIEEMAKLRQRAVVADIALLSAKSLPEPKAPTEAEINEYYSQRQNEYMTPERRSFSYLLADFEQQMAQVKLGDDEVTKAYEQRSEEFTVKEKREVEQLIYGSKDKAEEALGMLKAGASVKESAAKLPPENADRLSLGLIAATGLPEEASGAVFALNAGEVAGPIETAFGWNLFKVGRIEPARKKPLEEVREELAKELKTHAAEEALFKLASQVEDALAGGQSMEDTAKTLGLSYHKTPAIDAQGKDASGKEATDFIKLKENILKKSFAMPQGEHSGVENAKNGSFYVVKVESVSESAPRALDEIRGRLVEAWKKDRQQEALMLKGKELADLLRNNGKAGEYAGSQWLLGKTLKQDTDKIDEITLPPGAVLGLLDRGGDGVIGPLPLSDGRILVARRLRLTETQASEEEKSKLLTALRSEIGTALQQDIQQQYLDYLEQKFPVTINYTVLDAAVK